ncbi:glycine betaine ABC transporter substrate-binding protein [Methylocapsa acidiphila]|uniref:glycine betaine ABC transporter substrate-binding protein n=1 Tax=Methylocapsa acidiphila TaxID=133552 RepID=UPI0003FC870D|nr:glycine betaine ABC transporter substrate-binding protein [Methylocapsa acidiphila]
MKPSCKSIVFIALLVAALAGPASTSANAANSGPEIRIGSKKFTESVILAEMAASLAASAGATVIHRQELGGTRLVWDALLAHEIDVYPEYAGTLAREILANEHVVDEQSLEGALAKRGLRVSRSLGFNDSYALGMMRQTAERLRISKISDLARHPSLRFGMSDEFLDRADGWPALHSAYGLSAPDVRGVDHDIAYKGLVDGAIDVIDLYTTDAEIGRYQIQVLEDDRRHFLDNEAVLIYRIDLEQSAPNALRAMLQLQGRIKDSAMVEMNGTVKFEQRTEADVAAQFVATNFGIANPTHNEGLAARLLRRTGEHLRLTLLSLAAAIAVALPLGVVAAWRPTFGHIILALVSIVQTIPSLALLVFMIPLLGIGALPAIAALFLYSLLPIVRNTASGIMNIPLSIHNSAVALGLTPMRRLRLIEIPLASPTILAGIKTAAVINVGTATLGALIGAGGYGQPILTGIRLDNFNLILEGAAPAALLALFVEGLFELAERRLVPRGLRLRPNRSA